MSRPANEMVQMFTLPSEYERAAAEARRRQRMAELLASQEYDPSTVQNAPIPAAAPLVQGLQAFIKGRLGRQAEEALERAEAADVEEFENLYKSIRPQERAAIGPDAFADPMEMASKYTAPRMETYTPSEEERRTLLERSVFGKGSPRAKRYAETLLAQMDKEPEREEAPMVTGGMFRDPKTGQWAEIPGYTEQQRLIAESRRAPTAPREERLVSIIGPNGNPMFVRESEAVGRTPYTPRSAAQEAADAARAQTNAQREIDTQSALNNISELVAHPGRAMATGASSVVPKIPGTKAYDFIAKLDTFKAQTFVPMVSALKGMGALSDAEGKKLQAAVGALDPSMSEEEFSKELRKVAKTLSDKARAAGLNVFLPDNLEEVIELPPRVRK